MNDAEIQAELEAVARDLNVQRATLRLPSDESVFPIAYEHCEPGTHSIRDTPRLDMSKQPVVLKMQAGASQVVEDDCNVSTDDPGYHRNADGEIIGLLSVHDLTAPRMWTEEEAARARAAADRLDELTR